MTRVGLRARRAISARSSLRAVHQGGPLRPGRGSRLFHVQRRRQSRWCHVAGSCQALARVRLELLRDRCPVYEEGSCLLPLRGPRPCTAPGRWVSELRGVDVQSLARTSPALGSRKPRNPRIGVAVVLDRLVPYAVADVRFLGSVRALPGRSPKSPAGCQGEDRERRPATIANARGGAGQTRPRAHRPQPSAVVGSITERTALIGSAGKPPRRACSLMRSSLGAM